MGISNAPMFTEAVNVFPFNGNASCELTAAWFIRYPVPLIFMVSSGCILEMFVISPFTFEKLMEPLSLFPLASSI